MSRSIACVECEKDMGEVRDATLRKGVVHMCDPCNQARIQLKLEIQAARIMNARKEHNGADFEEVFKDIFGSKW